MRAKKTSAPFDCDLKSLRILSGRAFGARDSFLKMQGRRAQNEIVRERERLAYLRKTNC